jgi:hypothetical protein
VKSHPQKFDTSILLGDIRRLIENAQTAVATAVNASLTMLYWRIGRRIREDVLNEKCAQYGKEIVVTLSRQLEMEYFYKKNPFGHRQYERTLGKKIGTAIHTCPCRGFDRQAKGTKVKMRVFLNGSLASALQADREKCAQASREAVE